MRRLTQAAVVLALVLLPAGCGGDDDGSTDAATAPTPTVTAPSMTSTAPPTTSTLGEATRQTEGQDVGDCLRKLGFRLQGGDVPGGGTELPDYQIIFSGPRGGGYVGFYKNVSRATRVAAQLRKTAQRTSGASVERHGAINIVFIDLAGAAARSDVRGCLVT